MSEYENKQFEDTGFETPTTNAIVSEKSKVVAAVLAFSWVDLEYIGSMLVKLDRAW